MMALLDGGSGAERHREYDDDADARLCEDALFRQCLAQCDEAVSKGSELTIDDGPLADLPSDTLATLCEAQACLVLINRVAQAGLLAPSEDSPFDDTYLAPSGRALESDNDSTAAVLNPLSARERIGRFELRDRLGSGGFGIVYRAWDPSTQREVALKIPRLEALGSTELLQRFEREAHAAAKLDHPNIVSVLEAGADGMLPYIASVYCAGPTLAVWLAAHSEAAPPRAAARLIRDLATAVAHAHDRGVLHRDIKPSNILLMTARGDAESVQLEDCVPKLMDFGLAKIIAADQDMTRSGALFGTVRYMSPEQAGGRTAEIGPRADIYSLGVVLYELLTGRAPFEAASDIEVLRQINDAEPLRPKKQRRSIPLDLETICLRCLEKLPSRRYQAALELANDLDRYLRGEPIVARPTSLPTTVWKWCRRRPALAALATVVCAGVVVLFVGLFEHNRRVSSLLKETARERDAARTAEAQALRNGYAAEMHLALEAWRGSAGDRTLKILARHTPKPGEQDQRDFAWWYLHNLTQESELLAEHEGGVTSVTVSSDGAILATAGADGAIQLWDADTRLKRGELKRPGGKVSAIAFSPDGSTLAAVGEDGPVCRWRLPELQPIESLMGSTEWQADVKFSPDGKWIAAAGGDGLVRVWQNTTGESAAVLAGHAAVVRTIAFSRRGELFTASEDGEVRGWDVARAGLDLRLPDGKLRNPTEDHVFALSIESSQRFLVGTCRNGAVLSWDLTAGEDFGRGAGPHDFLVQPRCVASDAEDTLAVGDASGALMIARASRNASATFRVRYGHRDRINSVAYVPGRNAFLTGSRDGTARLYPGLKYVEPKFMSGGRQPHSLNWSDDDRIVSCMPRDDAVYLMDAKEGTWRDTLRIEAPTWAQLAEQQNLAIVLNSDQQVLRGMQLESKTEIWSLGTDAPVKGVALNSAGGWAALATAQQVLLIDLLSGQLLHSLIHPQTVNAVTAIPGTNLLASASLDGRLRIWDAARGKIVSEHAAHRASIEHVAASTDGHRLVTLGDHFLRVWDRSRWQLLGEIPETASVWKVAFLDRGETLIVQTELGLRLYRVADGAELLDLRGVHPVRAMAISPDGGRIATQVDHAIDFLDGRRAVKE